MGLILTRKVNQRILIQVDEVKVWLTVIDVQDGRVKLFVEAPQSVDVWREELLPKARVANHA